MEEITEALRQYAGIFMFVLAMTFFLKYVSEYNDTYVNLEKRIVKDTVILEIE